MNKLTVRNRKAKGDNEMNNAPTNNALMPAPDNSPTLTVIDRSAEKRLETVTRAASSATLALAENFLTPRKILKVGRVTVVFWNDYTTTAVRCGENEIPDDYTAFCAALGKKIFGCNSALKRAFMDAPTETREV